MVAGVKRGVLDVGKGEAGEEVDVYGFFSWGCDWGILRGV